MKILVLGYFGYNTNQLDGQTIKTRSIYEVLKEKYDVSYFDTQSIKHNRLALLKLVKMCLETKSIIFVGGKNNLTYFFPILFLIGSFRKINIVYAVVGGWLYDYLLSKPTIYTQMLKSISSILVETQFLKDNLSKLGLRNVGIIPNFRITPTYSVSEHEEDTEVFKIVFMARVTKAKGIYLLFALVKDYLAKPNNYKKTLQIDFFGPVDPADSVGFHKLINMYSSNVSYKGILEPSEIYYKLPIYDVLLLPTFYEGEGFPGTIIDAYLSALPVISTNWKQIPEFVKDGQTGFLIDYDLSELINKIKLLMSDEKLLADMKKHAFEYSSSFSSNEGLKVLSSALDKQKE